MTSTKITVLKFSLIAGTVPFVILYLMLDDTKPYARNELLPGELSFRELLLHTRDMDMIELPTGPNFGMGQYSYFQYQYEDPVNHTIIKGKVLNAPNHILRKHRIPLKYVDKLSNQSLNEFVFVMACTEDHFQESKDAIATIQKHYPKHTVLYYDWGLKPQQVKELKTICNVQHRPFNISEYPASKKESGRPLYQSSKIFCIMDALIDHPGVFWLDASIRFLNNTVMDHILQKAIQNGGFSYMSMTEHSSYAVTHPDMYKFLPTDLDVQKKLFQGPTYGVLMFKTRKVFDNIIWWWFLCSLHAECMTPMMELYCHFEPDDAMTKFAKCHRFDQSATNILANNLYGYNDTLYNYDAHKYHGFEVLRDSFGMSPPKHCFI